MTEDVVPGRNFKIKDVKKRKKKKKRTTHGWVLAVFFLNSQKQIISDQCDV